MSPMTITPGRYAAAGNDSFIALCGTCPATFHASWGRSGPAGAPRILRQAGWHVHGRTSGARWHCAAHPAEDAA